MDKRQIPDRGCRKNRLNGSAPKGAESEVKSTPQRCADPDSRKQPDLEQFQARFRRRYVIKKRANAVLCFVIFLLGVTALMYSALVNHKNLLDRLRYMTFDATIFTSLVSLTQGTVCLREAAKDVEVTSRKAYFLRLSSATMEAVILIVVMCGLSPLVPDRPDVTSYTGVVMHLVIPVVTVLSFALNDAPIGRLKRWEPLYGNWFLFTYSAVMIALFSTGILASDQAPYSFLDFEHAHPLFVIAVQAAIYAVGYLFALLLSRLNRKLSWIWFYDFKKIKRRR